MDSVPTIRIKVIIHAQAVRLPGHQRNSVQIDGIDDRGKAVRIVLQPTALSAMLAPAPPQTTHLRQDLQVARTRGD